MVSSQPFHKAALDHPTLIDEVHRCFLPSATAKHEVALMMAVVKSQLLAQAQRDQSKSERN